MAFLEQTLNKIVAIAIACLGASSPALAQAQTYVGVPQAVDGDSLSMAGASIRLFGIDAPEGQQTCIRDGSPWACGEEARTLLSSLVGNKPVTCKQQGIDQYGRVVAICSAGGIDLGEAMVSAGMALAYRKFSLAYVNAEDRAKQFKLGIWGSEFQEPAAWRAANPTHQPKAVEVQQPDESVTVRERVYKNQFGCAIKGNRNRKGQWIYHLPGMPYYDATRPEELFCTESQAQAAGYRRAIVR